MTICYLSDARSVHTRRWVAHFANRGHSVHVISFAPGSIQGATVHHVPLHGGKAAGLALALPRLRRLIRRIHPAVVHAHYVSSYGIAAALAGATPLVVTAWGSDVLVVPVESSLMRAAMRWALRRADVVVSVADHMADTMRAMGLRDEILSLPFGVDTALFHPGRRSAPPDFDLVCTRPCDPIYNVELLVRSLPHVVAARGAVTCALVGGGAQQAEMQTLANDLGVGHVLQFIGAVPHEDMGAWLGRARVFVSPARSDGNNISLNEAMACGCLPVCTDIPANREWIEHGVNGFLAPVDDPHAMAACIVKALEPPAAAPEWLAHNWSLVQARGNWNRNMEEMQRVYDRLVSGGTRR